MIVELHGAIYLADTFVTIGLKKQPKAGLKGPELLSYRTAGMSGFKCCSLPFGYC
jgi:hypothetical protein